MDTEQELLFDLRLNSSSITYCTFKLLHDQILGFLFLQLSSVFSLC